MLVSKIFPDREEYEEQQEKVSQFWQLSLWSNLVYILNIFNQVLAILSKNHSQQLMSTIGEAIKAQVAAAGFNQYFYDMKSYKSISQSTLLTFNFDFCHFSYFFETE